MVAILYSAILNSTILESVILVSCLKLTHTCQDRFPPLAQKKTSLTLPSPPFAQKKLHSFILSELDNGNHLEFCHVGFRHWHLGFRHILSSLRFTQKHSHSNLTLTQTNSFWLTWWWQQSWILPSWIQPFCTKKLHSFILTSPDDGSHLEFCHVGFRQCHLGFRHLVILSQIHSKTLSLYSDSDSY